MLVKDAMTRRAETIGPYESLAEAARRMRDVGVGALVVSEDGNAVGVLTDRDIVVRAVAVGLDPAASDVRSAMTAQVVECREDDDLAAAAARMGEGAVRRLVILDEWRHLVGLLSVDDIAVHSPMLAGEVMGRARSPEKPVHRGPWPWWEEPAS